MFEESLESDDGGGFPFQVSERSGIWIFSIFGAICVGLSGIFPLLVIPIESGPALKHGEPAKKLRLMLSFAVGSLLGDVFLHLLPEVWAHVDRSQHDSFTQPSLWVIGGLMGFMVIEKVLGETGDETDEEESDDDSPSNNNKLYSQLQSPSSHPSSSSSSSSKTSHTSSSSSSSSLVSSSSPSLSSSPSSSKKGRKEKNSIIKNGKSIPSNHSSIEDQQSKHKNKKHKNNNNKQSSKEESHQAQSPHTKIKISGYLNLFANVVDNFTHGLAVGTSFCVSKKCGLVTTIAILLHEIPHEVGDFAILLQSGFNKWKAAKAQVWTASGGVFGAITALSVGTNSVTGGLGAWMLPFTAGGFLYIALVTVVPDLKQEKQGWESLKQVICICLGILSIVFVTFALD